MSIWYRCRNGTELVLYRYRTVPGIFGTGTQFFLFFGYRYRYLRMKVPSRIFGNTIHFSHFWVTLLSVPNEYRAHP
ncbi:hypothetical protein HanRHA438_Chr01g0006581 [Helianthus annuus]|nr:hypothetical protein HanRHA438_Chr01g0006581 [Helianthus annuus]